MVNGDSEEFEAERPIWLSKTPIEIIEEFDNKYKKGKYSKYDSIEGMYDFDKYRDYRGGGGNFYNKFNNIYSIILNANVGEKKYEIIWFNKSV